MSAPPAYRTLVPGQQHFDCQPLRCTVSTTACGQRWQAAQKGTTCGDCAIGRLHAGETERTPRQSTIQSASLRSCARCHRTDLRLIHQAEICVSCQNRQYEWLKGRNAKGKPPETFAPLALHVIGTTAPDGLTTWRAGHHRHQSEALTFTTRKHLMAGAKFNPGQPGRATWDAGVGQFVSECPACHAPGLLERLHERTGSMRHHCQACSGTAPSGSWRLAVPRAPVLMLEPLNVALWLSMTGEAPTGPAWSPTEFVCSACQAGQVEARHQAGLSECRCPACGATGSARLDRAQGTGGGAA